MSTPLPVVFEASANWLGNDGNWSTFNISVGTPPQQFYVLPSTTASEIWLPIPAGCTSLPGTNFDCGRSRGIGPINGMQALGFMAENSSTWYDIGLYYPLAEQNLFPNEPSATYGLDTVLLDSATPLSLRNQTIGGIVTFDFWLGTLGLGSSPAHFDVLSTNPLSPVASMKASNYTPSLSYGFFAGAWYREDPAHLVFGGYDQSRLATGSVVVPIRADKNNETELRVNLRSLEIVNSLNGTLAFPDDTKNLSMVVDSTTPQLWLPMSICDRLAMALGLVYQNATGRYLITSATHERLLSLGPRLTFTVSVDAVSNLTVPITLPYSAFDLQLGIPFYNSSNPVRYFPIRRAANESQLTLGRTFLQEAYIVADYERGKFTVGQATHNAAKSIIPILPVAETGQKSELSTGAITGIAVGVVLGILLVSSAASLLWWRKRKQRKAKELEEAMRDEKAAESLLPEDAKNPAAVDTAELSGEHVKGEELASTEIHEVAGTEREIELGSNEVHELPQNSTELELGTGENEIHELPGSVVEKELPGRKSVESGDEVQAQRHHDT